MDATLTHEQFASFLATGSIDSGATEPERRPSLDAASVRTVVLERGHAIVTGCRLLGALDLRDLVVTGRVAFGNCELASMNATNAEFRGSLVLADSNVTGSVDLLGATIEGVLDLTNLVVTGDVGLVNCRIGSGLPAEGLEVGGTFTATELRVAASARFYGAWFRGPVDLTNCCVDRTLDLERCRFAEEAVFDNATALMLEASSARFHGDVRFDGMAVGADAVVRDSFFRGTVSFTSAKVGDELNLGGCVFHRELELAKVRAGDVLAQRSRFYGGVSVDDVAIALVFNARRAHFYAAVGMNGGSTTDLNFDRCDLRGALEIRNVRVAARLILANADLHDVTIENVAVAGSLFCEGARFLGAFRLENLRVAGHVGLGRSRDARPASFARGTIWNGAVVEQGVDFTGLRAAETTLNLTGTRIGADLTLVDVDVCDIDLSGSQIGGRFLAKDVRCRRSLKCANVTIEQDVTFSAAAAFASVDLYGTIVRGTLTIADTTIASLKALFLNVGRDVAIVRCTITSIAFDGATVAGTTDLRGAVALTTLRLRGGTFGAIALMESLHATDAERAKFEPASIDLAESAFAFVQADPFVLMTCFVDKTDRQPYLTLEQSLRRRGFDAQADAVYVRGRRNARAKLTRPSRVGDWLAWACTGYGTSFTRVIVLLVIVLGSGAMYFSGVTGPVRFLGPRTASSAAAKGDDNARYSCATIARPGSVEAIWLSVKSFVPASFPDSPWTVADDCPETALDLFHWRSGPIAIAPALTIAVVALLKLMGLIFIPIVLAMLAGLFRPSARA